ncbi:MAG: ABC transporter substrate binding protein [Planctomycetota bacterium]
MITQALKIILMRKGKIYQGRIFYPILAVLISLLLQSPRSEPLFAETASGKVLILNSDLSVSNYALAHTGFKTKVAAINGEIDLGSKWVDESNVRKTINNMNPDVIYCIGSKAYLLAYEFAENKNIVFSSIINWRRLPMGKNTYGVSVELLPSMQLTLYRYFFPEINKIGVVYSKDYNKEWLETVIKSAKDVGITIFKKSISKQEDVESALKYLLPKVDAVWLAPDPIVISKIESVGEMFKQCDNAGKPVLAYNEAFADFGATLIISADITTMGGQAAGIALDLLSDQKGNDKVQTPAGTNVILNLKQVEKYKIKLNEEALDSVNQIIK